jgi:hypothetical protein
MSNLTIDTSYIAEALMTATETFGSLLNNTDFKKLVNATKEDASAAFNIDVSIIDELLNTTNAT